jgi:uncharacterized protein (TIGR02594 family)
MRKIKTKVNLNTGNRIKRNAPSRRARRQPIRRGTIGTKATPHIADNDNDNGLAHAPDVAPAWLAASCNHAILASAVVVLTLLSVATVRSALTSTPRIAAERVIDSQVGAARVASDDMPLIVGALAPIPSVTVPPLSPSVPGIESVKHKTLTRAGQREVTKRQRAEQLRARQAKAARRASRKAAFAAFASVPGGSNLIAEARRYLGRNPTGWAHNWCGKFLDMVLRHEGYRGGGNLALAYAKYGHRLPGPRVGAIAVFRRRGGGHVGIVTGIDSNGNPVVISGNYNHRVAEATFPARLVVAYVSPRPVE